MVLFAVIMLLLLSFLGMPIAWSLGIASLGALIVDGTYPLTVVAQKSIAGMNSFALMAVPFFILAGNLMTAGGLTKRLLDIARVLVGWVRGSVSIICIVGSCFFGAISGSAIATASAIGGMTMPEMIKEGYDRSYAAAVSTGSAICGMLIPPSIPLIVYASITSVSVKDLFLGTLIPGIIYGASLCVVAYFIARKRNYKTHERASLKQILTVLKNGVFAIIMPVIILGCIFGGITTPTEASAIAVAYGLLVGLFIHRDIKFKDLYKIFLDSAITTAVMFMLIGISQALGWIVAITNISAIMTQSLLAFTSSKFIIVCVIILIGIILGCIMDVVCAVLIITPVLYSFANIIGYSAPEFGVILVTLLSLGHLTPPVGASLLLSNSIANARISRTIVNVIPFFCCGLGLVILLFLCPQLVSALL